MSTFEQSVSQALLVHMHACRRHGVSFVDCLRDARILFNRDVRKEADATPLHDADPT